VSGLVQPATFEVVADLPCDMEVELPLLGFGIMQAQTGIVRWGPSGDLVDQGRKPCAQLRKERPDHSGSHAIVGLVDQGVRHVGEGREMLGIAAAQVQRLFEHGAHLAEVIRRPCMFPRNVGLVLMAGQLGDELGRNLDRALIFASRYTEIRCVVMVVRQRVRVGLQLVEEPAVLRVDEPFVRELGEQCLLASSSFRATGRHVSRLVPVQHGPGVAQVVDVGQAFL